MTTFIPERRLYTDHAGERVRVCRNAHKGLWSLSFDIDSDSWKFSTDNLEMHSVGVYPRAWPAFAKSGAPGFVGTVPSLALIDPFDERRNGRLDVHPNAPGKMFFPDGTEFRSCRRVRLIGDSVIADLTKPYER